MAKPRLLMIGACAAIVLITTPLDSASAHGYHHGGPIIGLVALGAAAIVGVATIVTAPMRVLAAPAYAPGPAYYPPPPTYYYGPPPYAYYPPPPYYGR